MSNLKPCTTPAVSSKRFSAYEGEPMSNPTLYRSVIGALQYLTHTRPDISFIVNNLSQFLQHPSVTDWACSPDDQRSVAAYCLFLGHSLVAWSSKKQSVVARSSTESEY